MSKTVLLSDDLHSKIKQSKIMINGVEITMSLSKKIEHLYKLFEYKMFEAEDIGKSGGYNI